MIYDCIVGVVEKDTVDTCIDDPQISDNNVAGIVDVDAKVEQSHWATEDHIVQIGQFDDAC